MIMIHHKHKKEKDIFLSNPGINRQQGWGFCDVELLEILKAHSQPGTQEWITRQEWWYCVYISYRVPGMFSCSFRLCCDIRNLVAFPRCHSVWYVDTRNDTLFAIGCDPSIRLPEVGVVIRWGVAFNLALLFVRRPFHANTAELLHFNNSPCPDASPITGDNLSGEWREGKTRECAEMVVKHGIVIKESTNEVYNLHVCSPPAIQFACHCY